VSLTPVGDAQDDAVADAKAQNEAEKDDGPSLAELRWLLRHKRRSALETRGPEVETADGTSTDATTTAPPATPRLLASLVPDLAGTVEVMASPVEPDGDGLDSASYRVLRLPEGNRIAHAGQWSLGGLVAESGARPGAWRPSSSSSRARGTACRRAPVTEPGSSGRSHRAARTAATTTAWARRSCRTGGRSANGSPPRRGAASPTSASCGTATTSIPSRPWRSSATPTPA
jgi:hypothetical protein